jgi:phosphatidate phosphatase APP1
LVEKPKYILLPLTGILLKRNLWLEGQVLHLRNHHTAVMANESRWKNVIRIISAYLPGNIKSGSLEIKVSDRHKILEPSRNGFFNLVLSDLKIKNELPAPEYYFLRNEKRHKVNVPEFYNRPIFEPDEKGTGVISDIDDTIMVSHVKNYLKKIPHLLTRNAYRRKAVDRMSGTYRKLEKEKMNIFYVSNSEANLYPMIHTFLKHHKFPEGPLFLKPYKKWNDLLKTSRKRLFSKHKKDKIQHILDWFENKKFILIGDDSQHDGEIYSQIAAKNPGRIKGIFIRKTGKKLRSGIKKILASDHRLFKAPIHIFYDPDMLYDLIRIIV